jgi:hypothetical protein
MLNPLTVVIGSPLSKRGELFPKSTPPENVAR